MRVGIIGSGERATVRERAACALEGVSVAGIFRPPPVPPPSWDDLPELDDFLGDLDAVFITVPTAEHFWVARAAARQGVHVFLEWPPATSVRECERLVRLAEEAGVEAGVSRPLRFHAALAVLPAAWRAALVVVRSEGADGALHRRMADVVDLCSALAGSSSVQRIDAGAARTGGARPDALAVGLRFHNGAYAQLVLRRHARQPSEHLYAAGAGLELETDLADPPDHHPLAAETLAFLQALADRRPVPVSVLDGLHAMRLVERIMGKLR